MHGASMICRAMYLSGSMILTSALVMVIMTTSGIPPTVLLDLMRGGGYYDPPAQLSNAFVFEQMDRQAVQGHVGFDWFDDWNTDG